ncbi:hypothetical protein QBC39DRAFT_309685 [Podospora conica]|nr:hypothetical protein QBC39DRAFT_309685 [Schizothecium conicum]
MRTFNLVAGLVAAGSSGVLAQYTYPSPPAPTQPNTVTNCLVWHVVSAGDTCQTIETATGITHAQFLSWNPDVNTDCTLNFWGAYAYCVSAPPAPIHAGTATDCRNWHVVSAGDTCTTVETAAGITHAQFLAWNPAVNEDCTLNFWATYAYCVGTTAPSPTSTISPTTTRTPVPSPPGPTFTGTPSNCNDWHTVQPGDTCATIEVFYGISHAEFLSWNPAVSSNCDVNFWLGSSYCVGVGTTSSASTSSPMTTTSATSTTSMPPYSIRHPVTSETIVRPTIDTAWPPTKTLAGQPSYCNDWHLVLPGETCEDIAVAYSSWMGLVNLHAWNPAIGSDCSGLYVYHYVCVGIRPQTSLKVDWNTASTTMSLPEYVSVTQTPLPTYDYDEPFVPTPTHGPLPTDCLNWYQAQPDDTCQMALGLATEEQFLAWHPFLNGNCNGLWAGNYYCTWAGSEMPPPPTVTHLAVGEPVKGWITVHCNRWYLASLDTCQSIVDMFGRFSLLEFTQWNPSVGTGCANGVEDNFYYCVGVPGTPTTRTAAPIPIPTGTVPEEDPIQTQPGIAVDCTVMQLVRLDDTCARITSRNRITLEDFLTWNPSVGTDVATGCTNLLPNYHVCVSMTSEEEEEETTTSTATTTSMSETGTPSTTSSAPTTSATGGGEVGAPAPAPVQAGITTSCRRYYLVQEDDGCWAVADAAGIQLSDLYLWNPDLNTGGECWGLWVGFYVCIGVSGPVTTISAGPPLPTGP